MIILQLAIMVMVIWQKYLPSYLAAIDQAGARPGRRHGPTSLPTPAISFSTPLAPHQCRESLSQEGEGEKKKFKDFARQSQQQGGVDRSRYSRKAIRNAHSEN